MGIPTKQRRYQKRQSELVKVVLIYFKLKGIFWRGENIIDKDVTCTQFLYQSRKRNKLITTERRSRKRIQFDDHQSFIRQGCTVRPLGPTPAPSSLNVQLCFVQMRESPRTWPHVAKSTPLCGQNRSHSYTCPLDVRTWMRLLLTALIGRPEKTVGVGFVVVVVVGALSSTALSDEEDDEELLLLLLLLLLPRRPATWSSTNDTLFFGPLPLLLLLVLADSSSCCCPASIEPFRIVFRIVSGSWLMISALSKMPVNPAAAAVVPDNRPGITGSPPMYFSFFFFFSLSFFFFIFFSNLRPIFSASSTDVVAFCCHWGSIALRTRSRTRGKNSMVYNNKCVWDERWRLSYTTIWSMRLHSSSGSRVLEGLVPIIAKCIG